MANNTTVKRVHTSPGVYFKESELSYSAKSLGITTLGVVGETERGPAFQPISISSWREYQTYFGGTNTEKYRGSKYPKYELPYIAQSYLKQSEQLEVVRVLGLSGVNAGPAWVITAHGTDENNSYGGMVVAVLRSRGEHVSAKIKPAENSDECDQVVYDTINYYAKAVTLEASKSMTLETECNNSRFVEDEDEEGAFFKIDTNNYGRFTLVVTLNTDDASEEPVEKKYAVSLNPGDSNYIYNVIGGDPEKGEAEIYIEELYDIALKQLVELEKIDGIKKDVVSFPMAYIIPSHANVEDLLLTVSSELSKKNKGKRYLYSKEAFNAAHDGEEIEISDAVKVYDKDGVIISVPEEGMICKVHYVLNTETQKREYRYVAEYKADGSIEAITEGTVSEDGIFSECAMVKSQNSFYAKNDTSVLPITLDMNNYKEEYRYSSTPWIVSEIKGSAENVELTKLFRFHTISDGNASSTEVKVSIQNIDPQDGTFDVIVRDFNDTDANPVVVERFTRCNLIPGDENYIALKIGSFDESYESVSKYITVEVNETDMTKVSIPAGFLGYPTRNYNGYGIQGNNSQANLVRPYLQYNVSINDDIRPRKQYFGMSNIVGIDTDLLKYKGVEAYDEDPEGLTPCFHLDSRILNGTPEDGVIVEDGIGQTVTVDGVRGYSWVTVSKDNVTDMGVEPRIGNDDVMVNTIYEDKSYRKFTLCFYGGFDGWDYYRTSRSNSDNFQYTKYRGSINPTSGYGTMFNVIDNPVAYNLSEGDKAINSDYYAYLSAVKQFANPKTIEINVLATPGIDYVNQLALTNEVLELVEEDRADVLYVMTTPDKPYGASDAEYDMFSPEDAVYNLEDSDIDTNRACTYYPWEKYYDADNKQYIYLPITRDVVRSIALTDNITFPWYAAAGFNRGDIEGIKPKKKLKVDEQDVLYDGRINFVNTFANVGDKIWGDKNLQVAETQMNRISKRRLLLRIKKLCENACVGLLFDPNDSTQAQAFKSSITPILDKIKSNRGIYDYRIEIDDSEEARERLELPAKIFVKPTRLLEFIDIELVITPNGVQWS